MNKMVSFPFFIIHFAWENNYLWSKLTSIYQNCSLLFQYQCDITVYSMYYFWNTQEIAWQTIVLCKDKKKIIAVLFAGDVFSWTEQLAFALIDYVAYCWWMKCCCVLKCARIHKLWSRWFLRVYRYTICYSCMQSELILKFELEIFRNFGLPRSEN